MKKLALLAILVLVSASAVVGGGAKTEAEGAPPAGPVISSDDMRGALVKVRFLLGTTEEIVRVVDIEWQRLADGTLTYRKLEGKNSSGEDVYDFQEMADTVPVDVRDVGLFVRSDGFLALEPTGDPLILLQEQQCGIWHPMICEDQCYGECDAGCAVCEGSGWCHLNEGEVCTGSCPENTICNTALKDCKCVPNWVFRPPLPTSPGDDGINPPDDGKAKKLEPK